VVIEGCASFNCHAASNQMHNKSSPDLRWLVLALTSACHFSVVGQEVNDQSQPPSTFQPQPVGTSSPGSSQSGTPYMGTSALAASSLNAREYGSAGPGFSVWGPFSIDPHVFYSFTYASGLEALPTVSSSTAINTVSPGLLLQIGSHWTLDYVPRLTFYSNPLFHNTTDQNVVLKGRTTYGDWTLSLLQSYINTTDPLVETGTQVEQDVYATAINANWQMNDHLSLQLGLNQNFRDAQVFSDLHEWQTSDWIRYQFERQLGVAFGVTAGYDELSLGPSMPFERVEVGLNFRPGNKLSLNLVGGIEDRQFVQASAPSLMTPIFSAIAGYQILDGTSFTFAGERTVTPSFFGNEVNVLTSATGSVRQHIVGTVYFSVVGGYVLESFTTILPGAMPPSGSSPSTTAPLTEARSDSRKSLKFSLSATLHTRLNASIFYLLSDNASNQANFSYSGNQVGLLLDYRF